MVSRPLAAQHLSRSNFARARWLVIAPHADDETLGAGALIADTASRDVLAGVVILTNGEGSHSHDGRVSRARLIAMRRAEARLAVRRLTGPKGAAPLFLDWQDAHPEQYGSPAFDLGRQQLAALCRTLCVDAIAVTARHEPHCDHEAAFVLAQAVADTAMRPIAVFEYVVWAPAPAYACRALRTRSMPSGLRKQALAAHASQISSRFGEGFRLPAERMSMPPFDLLYKRMDRHARNA